MRRCILFLAALAFVTSCARQKSVDPAIAPKAQGTQIVEVSGGRQIAGVGSRLDDPAVVQVNGADGNAVTGALVTLGGDGLAVNPTQALTDASGQVSATIRLGGIPGNYELIAETAKSGGGALTVSLREVALGYQAKLGQEVSDKYCRVCHDPESTPERVSNFDNLVPPQPHQFTDGSTLNSWTDADLVKIISDGGPSLGKSPQTPAYRYTLTQAQIKAVVAYIRAIADPPYQSPKRY